MIAGELGLLLILLFYASWMMTHFDFVEFQRNLLEWYLEYMNTKFESANISPDDLPAVFQFSNTITYGLVGILTLVYQGGLALFYHRQRPAIAQALDHS